MHFLTGILRVSFNISSKKSPSAETCRLLSDNETEEVKSIDPPPPDYRDYTEGSETRAREEAIEDCTENSVSLQIHTVFNLGPVLLGRWIRGTGKDLSLITRSIVSFYNDLIGENMKKKQRRKWVRFEADYTIVCL